MDEETEGDDDDQPLSLIENLTEGKNINLETKNTRENPGISQGKNFQ